MRVSTEGVITGIWYALPPVAAVRARCGSSVDAARATECRRARARTRACHTCNVTRSRPVAASRGDRGDTRRRLVADVSPPAPAAVVRSTVHARARMRARTHARARTPAYTCYRRSLPADHRQFASYRFDVAGR